MSYNKLFTDAVSIAGKCWWLWLFGFFISLSDAGSSIGQVLKYVRRDRLGIESLDYFAAVAASLILLAFVAVIVYLILMIVSESSLIVAVNDLKRGGPGSLVASLSEGVKYFWRLLGIWFAVFIVAIAFAVICITPLVLAFIAHVVFGILALLIIIPIFIVGVFVVTVVAAYAFRFAVLDDKPFLAAIDAGRIMLKENVGPSIAVALISFFTQLAIGIFVLILAVIIGVPFLVAGTVNIWLGLIPGIIAAFLFMVVVYGFSGVYASGLWTLAYLQLRGTDESVAPEVAPA